MRPGGPCPGRLRTILTISRVTSPALAGPGTAFTSLVAVPLVEVALLVAVSGVMGASGVVATAYAGVLVAFGVSVVGGVTAQVTRDRQLGVVRDVLTTRFLYVPFWLGKALVPAVCGTAVAVAGSGVICLLDPAHAIRPLVATLLLLPVVMVVAALVGVAVSAGCLVLNDPYLLANAAEAVLPITAGVVAPLAAYPPWLAAVAHALPFTAAVEALRLAAFGTGPAVAGRVALLCGRELLVAAVWFAAGIAVSRLAVVAMRSGRWREDLW